MNLIQIIDIMKIDGMSENFQNNIWKILEISRLSYWSNMFLTQVSIHTKIGEKKQNSRSGVCAISGVCATTLVLSTHTVFVTIPIHE